MRFLKKREVAQIDADYVYRNGNVVAIIDADFDDKYDVIPKRIS